MQWGWKHQVYDEIREQMTEQDDFLYQPFEVVDGVEECLNVLHEKPLVFRNRLVVVMSL